MRYRMWHFADLRGREVLVQTHLLLEPHREALERFARVLCREKALSGDRLVDELRAAGLVEAPTAVPE